MGWSLSDPTLGLSLVVSLGGGWAQAWEGLGDGLEEGPLAHLVPGT